MSKHRHTAMKGAGYGKIAVSGLLVTSVGLLATALLLANNLRDIATDVGSGKRTLAVRVGRRSAGWCYVGAIGLPGTVVAFAGWIFEARPPTDQPPS